MSVLDEIELDFLAAHEYVLVASHAVENLQQLVGGLFHIGIINCG